MTNEEAIRRLAKALADAKVVIARHEAELAEQRADLAKAVHHVDAMRKLFFKQLKKQEQKPRSGSNWHQYQNPEIYKNGPRPEQD